MKILRNIWFILIVCVFLLGGCEESVEEKKIIIYFDSTGGSSVSAIVGYAGDEIVAPSDPVKDGYIFNGWYLNGKRYEFTVMPSSNITLVATWESEIEKKKNFIVSFETDGGTLIDDQVIESGNCCVKPKNPVKEDFIFKGWYLGEELFDFKSPILNDTTLVALWEEVHKHSYSIKVIDPTCQKKGFSLNFCECGDQFIDNYVDVVDHEYVYGYCKWCENELYEIVSSGLTFEYSPIKNTYSVIGIGDCLDVDIIIPPRYNGIPVTSIGFGAFSNCTDILSVTIPGGVSLIGQYAFSGCSSLVNVITNEGLSSIGSYAFSNCSNLENINLPSTLNSIGNYLFDGCLSLSFNVYDNARYLGSEYNPYLFLFDTIDKEIKTCKIYNGTRFIYHSAFKSCTKLTNIEIPKSIRSIGDYAFYDCNRLSRVNILDGTLTIGQYAFYNCSSLINFELSSSVKMINSSAFLNCESLENVYYNGNIESWCNLEFVGYMARDTTPMYYADHFFLKDEYGDWKEVTEIIIPDTVTHIGDYQFDGFTNVLSFVLSKNITSIGYSAFADCKKIESIILYDNVKIIGDYAFSACSNLKSIILPTNLLTIGKYSFYNCVNLQDVVIPLNVITIGYYAFAECRNLTIYCVASDIPEGWDSHWNYSNRPVYLGYEY